jgi:alpha-beta hydrolase superfamily lysophospholipase
MSVHHRMLGMLFLLTGAVCACSASRPGLSAAGQRHTVPSPAQWKELSCDTAGFSLRQWRLEQERYQHPAEQRSVWMPPVSAPERAVAMVVHGLNLKPSKMNGIARVLNAQGVRVLRVALKAHGCTALDTMRQVTPADWRYDLLRGYCIASEYAADHGLPLYYVGYSMGGTLMVDLLQQPLAQHIAFDAMVLFAPGIALRPYAAIGAGLIPVLSRIPLVSRWAAPTLSVAGYNCYAGTPVSAYYARHPAYRHVRKVGLAGLDRIPTLIFVDPHDEIVSQRGIAAMIRQAGLRHWELVEVDIAHSELEKPRHHLIIDAPAVGAVTWRRIVDRLRQHLGLHPR